jgi:hypothetical protein
MDRGLDEFKPENIKECDQKMLSIIKGKAQELFDEQKRKCGEYGYRLEKCKKSLFIEIKRNFRNKSSIDWSLKQIDRLYSMLIVIRSLIS